MRTHARLRVLLLPACLMVASGALAQQAPQPPRGDVANATPFGVAIDPARLETQRGGDGTLVNHVDNTSDIHGDVSGNTANNVVSGNNLIDGGSFAGNAGIATVIQNTGSNVLIQNGMVVSVQFIGGVPQSPP